jgi:hypothetical protein
VIVPVLVPTRVIFFILLFLLFPFFLVVTFFFLFSTALSLLSTLHSHSPLLPFCINISLHTHITPFIHSSDFPYQPIPSCLALAANNPDTKKTTMPESDKNRILIVGAGVGGVMLGILLHKAGIPFDIYERAAAVKPLGKQHLPSH